MIDDNDFDFEIFDGAIELQRHERGESFSLDPMTYFRLARCCNDASAMHIEPCVICRLPGSERGCKVVLYGRKHAYNLSVRVFRSCTTIDVSAEPLDHSCVVRIPLFETDNDDDRGWSHVLRSMTTAEGVGYVDRFWGEDDGDGVETA
jgi:hypothetical protein